MIHGFRSAVLGWSSAHCRAPACAVAGAVRTAVLEVRGQKNVNYVFANIESEPRQTHYTSTRMIYSDEEYKYFPNKKSEVALAKRLFLTLCVCEQEFECLWCVPAPHRVTAGQKTPGRRWLPLSTMWVLVVSLGSRCLYLPSPLAVPNFSLKNGFSDLSSVGFARRQLDFSCCFCVPSVVRVCLPQTVASHRL